MATRSDTGVEAARDTVREFREAVNMTAAELRHWLDTDASRAVGQKNESGSGESVGHRSGRRILALLDRRRDELTEADRDHMRKVVGYVHRHLAQRPDGDVTDTPWRHSLMNWGHDPLKG
ncbi:MAG TPA: DUF3140 domain-containing protein [Pilimelia sp.]|nr:DUF3140 domain-containing protein [Pilimelia sp.]